MLMKNKVGFEARCLVSRQGCCESAENRVEKVVEGEFQPGFKWEATPPSRPDLFTDVLENTGFFRQNRFSYGSKSSKKQRMPL